jgi:heme-degrading monooxygenase HmoA
VSRAPGSDGPFAELPEPPYWVVVFSSQRRQEDADYERTAWRMVELARSQPGFLGVESARSPDGFGITVSYWASEEAIRDWRRQAEHRAAQELGREAWYSAFRIRVARVERGRGRG